MPEDVIAECGNTASGGLVGSLMVVPVVNSANPIDCLSLEGIAEILTEGGPASWASVTGIAAISEARSELPSELVVVAPGEASEEFTALSNGLHDLGTATIILRPDVVPALTSAAVVEMVSLDVGAIGFVKVGSVEAAVGVKPVEVLLPLGGCSKIDSRLPETEEYPFAVPIYLHIIGTGDAAEFARFAFENYAQQFDE